MQIADENFTAAGGLGPNKTRTIRTNWAYWDITWLVKIKTDSEGNVHYEAWSQPHNEKDSPHQAQDPLRAYRTADCAEAQCT